MMKNFVKTLKNNEKAITLISLVVTVIVLLILAGISIGMLSGDNSIIKQAGNAKTQTDIAQEKEILEQATVVAMGKSRYGDIDETYFTNELEKNNATFTKSGSKYKVTFSSGRQYTVDQDGNIKEKNPNVLEVSELYENASTYFGWDVINYAETLPSNLQDTEWQLFYAGTLDGETEERIYLISKKYVKNTQLPNVIKNGVEVEGAKPIIPSGKTIQARFYLSGQGVLNQYTGSSDISTEMQRYNKNYFNKGYTSTYNSMKAVAYMLDTVTWNKFATSTEGYAEYAFGGPTVELLFTAYNKYKQFTGDSTYMSDAVSSKGYQISKDGGNNYTNYYNEKMIESDTSDKDSPYIVSNTEVVGYYTASPSNFDTGNILIVSGKVDTEGVSNDNCGFRPMVLLNSNYILEKTKDINGNDAFKIVER